MPWIPRNWKTLRTEGTSLMFLREIEELDLPKKKLRLDGLLESVVFYFPDFFSTPITFSRKTMYRIISFRLKVI